MIEQFWRIFEGGRRWYLDGVLGDDNNDGKSWETAKQHWSAIQGLLSNGDTVYIRNILWDRIIVNNVTVRIVGIGEPSIWAGDWNEPVLEVNGGRVFAIGLRLASSGGYAEQDCVLLEDLPKGTGIKRVKIYGGVADIGVGCGIGDIARLNLERLDSTKLVNMFKTKVVEKPVENQDWVRVQGNIATSPWLPAEGNMIAFKGLFFPIFKVKSYTNITYDEGTNTSVISGLNPPFRAWEIPEVNDDVALCLMEINTDNLEYDHYKGEYMGSGGNFKQAFKIDNRFFGTFCVFQGCSLGWFNINYTDGIDVALHLIFDGCQFTNFSPFKSIIGADLSKIIAPVGFKDCVFFTADGTRLLKVVNAENPVRFLFRSGAFFHNVVMNVDFWNFELQVVRDWISSFGLDYSKKVDSDYVLEFPFRENIWGQVDFLSLLLAVFFGIDTERPIYQLLTEKKKYPLGDISEWAKDTAPLENWGGIEVPLVYDVGEILKGLMKIKRIEIVK